jgi:hypothetical protein
MTLGLEEFLKELRAEEGVTALAFDLFDSDRVTFHFMIYTARPTDKLKFSWTFDKTPEDFTPMRDYIKKEIKNQPKS